MKRKVVNAGKLRLSPNEEAFILKEDYERRRKLRLLQVREQERDIALQIREDIKQRRYQQFTRLAEELRAEWEESQTQKVKSLEKLYLASLRNVGEGHRQAKENEPDLEALAWQATERKRRAEVRHKEALKEQKNKKEILMKQKTRHIKARKKALLVEKERSSKITSLPPPPPSLFENIEVKRISSVKTSSSTYHHLYTLVNREVDTEQPDAHLAAEEEAKRLEELQKQVAQERMEQFEKAHVRGFQAMKKIHFAQNQEKLMKELKQLQQEDLARRRQTVARMPQQLVELPYKRNEMKEDWQRELEFAFEDMYNADRKVKGNLILHLEPEPLPTVIDQTQDDELDLSMEQENLSETESLQVTETEELCSSETNVPLTMKTQQVPSKILFKKLLNKIRSQISLRAIKSMSADESEVITAVDEMERKTPIQSETIASEERTLLPGKEQVTESDILTIESGPLTSEDKPLSCSIDSGKEQEINETQPTSVVAQSLVLLLHPQEETTKIRISARQKQIMEIEEQKQKQLELLEQIEQQKLRLETDCFRAHLEEEKRKNTQQPQVGIVSASCAIISDEESHRQMIRNYQHQLLEQNRLHRQSVETARKQLHEYQSMLKERYPSMLATSLTSHSVLSVPPQKSERPNVTSEHWNHSERPKLHPNKYQPIQISKLEQDHFQKQLDLQRKVLHYGQRAQKELLVQRQTSLQQQIQKHQETLKAFFKDNQTCKPKVENDIRTQKMEQLREWFPHLEDPAQDAQEGIRHADGSSSDDNQLLSGDAATQSGEHLGRRSSKPPLAKVKCGLDLNQHELSAIQEVESPGSGKTSIPGKTEFYQDRDPMRVSISREQSLLGSSLDGDPFGHLQPVAQKNAYGDCDEAVTVKESVFENCGVFSYAVEKEQCTHLSPAVKPDCKGKALEISYEPLSSVTVSTGSFLSCENPDLSLTDPEDEFTSDQMHIQQIIDKYINEANLMPEKTDFRVPTVDLDFPELEHTFPNFHRQLFKPLEPHPDSDLSSSSSGISQENPDISKSSNSSSESHHAALSSRSTVSSTALRRTSSHSFLKADLNQQLDPNSVGAAAQSFATKNIEGCEQPFQQLLPGFSSQERSQHPDLPSIFSIEARDPSQGMENQNYSSEQSEILQIKKKGVHFQPSVENLPSSVFSSSDEAHVFDQLNVQHSTPCCSTSSDCSMKEQLESRKERQCFEELLEKGVDTRLERQGFIKDDNNRSCRVLGVNPTEETDSQLWVRTVEMGTPQSLTMQNENYFENSAKTETPEILRNPSPLAPSECFVSSGSLSIQSSIPVWETASGHGIMEEPELTFSNSDISVAETDFESLTLEEKREYKAKSFQVGEFLPLVPETETSDSPAISENSGTMGPPQPAETLVPKCTVIPGSLQEAFLIRKKPFITKSSQRQKEIKNKVRVSENSPGSPVSHLRRVASRVCLPEDRKTQEAYAQNRARAKEFHKKTLEKLRAKNAF
ncbi:centrosomal protein of 295 kDa isoform X4 [Dasypus novemcinctus]|uniref:centrosomal protein of 295 kDa isoform X4 n=1 Tax=Dasypus novemcinctus TaxID=9361 RepID=UPI00265E53C1|nr:centrosomal protein of 295 kDa [Dasypus novemcinctus]